MYKTLPINVFFYLAAAVAGMALGGTPGEQAFFVHTCVVPNLCLLECLGFTYYFLIVVPMLPIPQQGVCKVLPDCGHDHQSLLPNVMHAQWLESECPQPVTADIL